jgi:hypothetical protein
MTKQDFNLKTKKEEIALHLKEHHSFSFNDRRSLSVQDFMFEHFPDLVKEICNKDYGYLNPKGRDTILKARKKLTEVLRYCEEKRIPVAKVLDFNEDNDAEWRICRPTQEQVGYLRFKRWFRSAEGFFNKAVLQEAMVDDVDVEQLMNELKMTIKEKQEIRERKRKKKEIEVEN